MKINELRSRLRQDRPMTPITIRMPKDALRDLKRVAPLLGFSGYQSLMRAYIGQGLRADLERLHTRPQIKQLVNSLRRHGVAEDVITTAIAKL